MPDFSTIAQDPTIRALVQEGALERAFHDALFPRQLYRSEAGAVLFPGNVGDSMIFTGSGLIPPKPRPMVPGTDPTPSTYSKEQWEATIQQYADAIDTHMPSSVVAIANLFLRDSMQLGLSAGQTLNRIVRNRLFAAALSGHTVCNGGDSLSGTSESAFPVMRLNGFTKARRPDLAAGSPVRYQTVSASNPLPIRIVHSGGTLAANVVGFTPATSGDETGPGTLSITYASGSYTVADRAAVYSDDRTHVVRVGGGTSVDALATGENIELQHIRSAVARMRLQNVPSQPDGTYHCHIDPMGEAQLFGDAEFQRLLTSLPDSGYYADFAIGRLLGTTFYRNSESPLAETVGDGTGTWDLDDPFAGELTNGAGLTVRRAVFIGAGAIYEYYQDLGALLTEAGVTGKVGQFSITNNGIQVVTDRIQLIIRAPLDRLQQNVSTAYKFVGDWPVRTDVTSGDAARYKRMCAVEFTD